MKINYRFPKNFNSEQKNILKEYNIDIDIGFDAFTILNTDKYFNEVKELFKDDWESLAFPNMIYNKKEYESADTYVIHAKKYLGYAKPDTEKIVDTFEFPYNIEPQYKGVFKVKAQSKEFGMLKGEQIGYYQMKGEPKWGKNHIASLFDVFDDFFVKPEVYKNFFEPLGIESRKVLDFKTRKPLKTVIQLVTQGISKYKLNIDPKSINISYEIKEWGITKYVLRGDKKEPLFTGNNDYDFFRSQEYFGDGGMNLNNIYISKKLYNIITDNKLKGLNIEPLIF